MLHCHDPRAAQLEMRALEARMGPDKAGSWGKFNRTVLQRAWRRTCTSLNRKLAGSYLSPWPPFPALLLGPSLPKPDLYSITHGPQMLLFSFPSSMGGGAPSAEMPVLWSRLVCPQYFREGICSSPKHLENAALFGLLKQWWEQDGKVPSQWGTSPHCGLYF